jgi:uncharacterized protein
LADKADVNAAETNKYGGTPLHWAVRHGRAEAAKHLLAKGADARVANARNGQTALHVLARHHDDVALAEMLLAKGVDPAVKDRFGKTAREYAEQGGRTAVLARLTAVR